MNFKEGLSKLSIRIKMADRDLFAAVHEGSWLKDQRFFTDEAVVEPQLWSL